MIKEKQLYILGGVFAGLLLIYFVTKPRMANINYDEIVQTIVFGFENQDVNEIEVYKQTVGGEARMQFVKQDDQWYIPTKFNAKARESNVNRIINDMLEMTGKVAASDPRHFETFEIADEQGIHVILKDEAQKPLANIIVGKKGEDYGTGFVRFSGQEKIYRVDKNLLSSLGIYGEADTLSSFNEKSFIDLNAVKLEQKDLELVGLVAGGKEMVIKKVEKEPEEEEAEADTTQPKKKEYEWVLMKGKQETKLDQKEVDSFLRAVTSIYAQEVVDNIGSTFAGLTKSSRYRFDRPTHYIVFMKKGDDDRYNVIFGKEYEKDKGYYMNVQYDNLVYKVGKSKYDTIFKWVDDLPKKLPKEEEKKET